MVIPPPAAIVIAPPVVDDPIVPPSLITMSSTKVTIPVDAIVIAVVAEAAPIVPPSLISMSSTKVTIPVDAIVIAVAAEVAPIVPPSFIIRSSGIVTMFVDESDTITVPDAFGNDTVRSPSGSTTVSVNEPDHGRSTSQTVVFRNSSNVVNLPAATINSTSGYTITKVDDNNYTFVSGVTASKTQKGGGGFASAGPVTLTP